MSSANIKLYKRILYGCIIITWGILTGNCLPQVMRFMYNRADYFVLQRIDRYFDIDASQKEYLKLQLAALHEWHRQNELPRYLSLLDELQKRIDRTLQRKDILWAHTQMRSLSSILYKRLQSKSLPFLMSLQDTQIQHLQEVLAEENEELQEKLELPLSKRLEKRMEKYLDNSSDWLGSLSDEQEELLRARLLKMPDIAPVRWQMRLKRQKNFIAILKLNNQNKKDKQNLLRQKKRLQRFLTAFAPQNYAALLTPREHVIYNANRLFLYDYLLALAQIATPTQRKHFREKLNTYRNIIILALQV